MRTGWCAIVAVAALAGCATEADPGDDLVPDDREVATAGDPVIVEREAVTAACPRIGPNCCPGYVLIDDVCRRVIPAR